MKVVHLLFETSRGNPFVVATFSNRQDAERSKFVREYEVCGPNNDITYFISEVPLQ